MKKILIYSLALLVVSFGACRKIEVDGDSNNEGGTTTPTGNLTLAGQITTNTTLKAGNTYKLQGFVYVTNNAVLTIEPGTRIEGVKSSTSVGALVITKGSKIMAEGTKDKPIVFTSDQGSPKRGDWGGVVILGKAPVNASYNNQQGIGAVEGGVNNAFGLGTYGGSDPADNSGILKYVRIEYAGYAYLPNDELNALTLAGVGNGTTIDYVETFKSNDDGIECFGGTVNLRHIVMLSTLDDDFDTDNGWSGNVQFGIVMRDSSVADVSRSESFESDNDANGSSLTPQTSGVYSNITIIGPAETSTHGFNSLYLAGAQIRRNSAISIFNSVFMGYPVGIFLDAKNGVSVDQNLTSGKINLQNITIAGAYNKPLDYFANLTSPTGFTLASFTTWFNTTSYANSILTNNTDVKITAPFNYTSPDFTPQTGSPLLNSAAFTHAKLPSSFFTPVTFRGAVGTSGEDATWWKDWTKLDLTK